MSYSFWLPQMEYAPSVGGSSLTSIASEVLPISLFPIVVSRVLFVFLHDNPNSLFMYLGSCFILPL
ncbi:hypothetical protein J2Z23_002671 [Lederbergia galactosidilyticus]|nr:hypothetical protein [Lederbergia galactosidilytica]